MIDRTRWIDTRPVLLLFGGPADGRVLRMSASDELPPWFGGIMNANGVEMLVGGVYELARQDVAFTDAGAQLCSATYRWRPHRQADS